MNNDPSPNPHAESAVSAALAELALDLRWSFNHAADALWQSLDPELWELTHNPWFVFQTASREKLRKVTSQGDFPNLVKQLVERKHSAEESASWFEKTHPNSPLKTVAFFSMEFMLSEALPIYSGGLGNVAGDLLKTASNLGVPVIGVGLLYQQGYFRQGIDADGEQQAFYPFNDPGQLPITPLREANGEWLRFPIAFPGSRVWIRTWQVKIGRTKLYLLDTNDPANLPVHRGIASELYGGGPDLRLQQEQVLGIGGWRLLRNLGLRPEVCHLNEGHAAFAALERARSYMIENHAPFDLALTITRAGNLFTTHTPVEAGFDHFAPELMQKYFKKYAEEELSIPVEDFLALGRRNPQDRSEPFNTAYLAIRCSGAVTGVSRLHGKVSRRIFQTLFPRWPEVEVPVTHVTNGVHMPTWDSAESDRLWESACGKDRWRGITEGLEADFRCLTDADLWQLRADSRKGLIEYIRKRLTRQLANQGASPHELEQAERILDVNTLTIGFARRFTTYKRPNLLLHDPQRLIRMLTNRERPVQIILAGKAHPRDGEGQRMIREWVDFARRPEVWANVVFLSDYDMLMAERLVQGLDLWVNTPRRPWEACGTSGMKVLVNGGLNISELDGWWAEAYSPDVGWAIGDLREHGDDPTWDAADAESLYEVLEGGVIPEFYSRQEKGIPTTWVARMRESMSRLTPRFSANRAVREYTERQYLPASATYRARSAAQGKVGIEILHWRDKLIKHWQSLRFGSATINRQGSDFFFQVQVYLDELDPEVVQVELYADGRNGDPPLRHTLTRGERLVGAANSFAYSAQLQTTRPVGDFSLRVIPNNAGASVPLEAPFILWHDSLDWRS